MFTYTCPACGQEHSATFDRDDVEYSFDGGDRDTPESEEITFTAPWELEGDGHAEACITALRDAWDQNGDCSDSDAIQRRAEDAFRDSLRDAEPEPDDWDDARDGAAADRAADRYFDR